MFQRPLLLFAIFYFCTGDYGQPGGGLSSLQNQRTFATGDTILVYVNIFTPGRPVTPSNHTTPSNQTEPGTTGAAALTTGSLTGGTTLSHVSTGDGLPPFCSYYTPSASTGGAVPATTGATSDTTTGTSSGSVTAGGTTHGAPSASTVGTSSTTYPPYGTGSSGNGVYVLTDKLIQCTYPAPPPSPPPGCTPDTTAQSPDYVGLFYPQIDDFSALSVFGSGRQFVPNTNYTRVEVSITVSSNGKNKTSDRRVFKDLQNYSGKYSAIFAAVINFQDDGSVCAVQWDDDCTQCSRDYCINGGQCGVATTDSCGDTNNENCNIQIYLAFTGKDNRGNYFTSAGKLPSRFEMFALNPVYQAAAGLTDERFFSNLRG